MFIITIATIRITTQILVECSYKTLIMVKTTRDN